MRLAPTIAVVGVAWLAGVTLLNTALNGPVRARAAGLSGGELRVGYLPVTCHLTCPVAHYLASEPGGDGLAFRPIRFQGWPELKESLLAGELDAAFILAPMAIALREQGIPIKVVHLGHRDGSTWWWPGTAPSDPSRTCADGPSRSPGGSQTSGSSSCGHSGTGGSGWKMCGWSNCPRRTCRRLSKRARSMRSAPASRSWPRPRWPGMGGCCSRRGRCGRTSSPASSPPARM